MFREASTLQYDQPLFNDDLHDDNSIIWFKISYHEIFVLHYLRCHISGTSRAVIHGDKVGPASPLPCGSGVTKGESVTPP